MLRILSASGKLLTAISILALCACQPSDTSSPARPEKPLISGLELSGMNKNIRPQDDFFEYANGTWLSITEIPADKSSWGSFAILHEQNLKRLQDLVQAASQSGGDSQAGAQISSFYKAFMGEAKINSLGVTPLEEDLAAIESLADHDAVAAYFGSGNRIGLDSPLGFWIDQDAKNTTRYIVYMSQSGLGLPDRDYYFDESERGKELRQEYIAYVTKLLGLAGVANAENAAMRIMTLETRLAEHQWTKVENRDRDKTYNKVDIKELSNWLPNYNLDRFFANFGIDKQSELIVRQPSYVKALDGLFRKVDLDTWKDYLRLRLLESFSSYLSDDFVAASFDFYGRVLNGQPELEPRWKRAINAINRNMGELLGQLYVAEYFPPDHKAQMVELVDNLQKAYAESIKQLDWMSTATQKAALDKLAKFTPKIGYPDKWRDYSALRVTGDDLVGNIKRVRQFDHTYELNKLGGPVNRDEWFMSPQTINAYYNPSMNEIVFPAAILQPPFFNPDADDAVNYGAIGAIIGHEIGHGFDDQGSKSDGDGNLVNWWTEEDLSRFKARTGSLVKQYGAFEPLPGLHVNGELTLGENIGDLGGLSIAYKAYQLSLDGKPAPVIDGFTGAQRVFLGWAQAWRVKRRDQALEQLLKTDPHAPARYRVNGVVTNIDAFYEAFEVSENDKLYLPPRERVKIW